MIHIESNSATDEELKEAMKYAGIDPLADEKPTEVVEEPKTEPEGEPGDKVAAEPEGKTAPVTEPEKKPSQEAPAGEPEKAKGGWARKVDKLTAAVDSLKERLEEKDGNEAKIRAELEAAKAELAKAKASPEVKEVGPVKPKRPSRGDLSEWDYDENKYEQALEKYDSDLDTYHREVSNHSSEEAVKKERERQAKETEEAKVQASNEAFGKRLDPGKANYSDWKDVFDEIGDRESSGEKTLVAKSDIAAGYIWNEAENPADLLYFIAKDHLESDGSEADRLMSLSPFRMVIELKAIEDRIKREREAATAPPAEPAKAAAETPKTPVKETIRPLRTPDAPIEPVGGRTTANPGNLDKQLMEASERGDGREVRRIRDLQRVTAAKAAGRIPA